MCHGGDRGDRARATRWGTARPCRPATRSSCPSTIAAQNGGCPAADTEIQTDSSFSLEHFIPAAVDATCTGSKGVVALNTATDNNTVAEDFASGSIQMGFIDDPADPTQGTLLAGKGYAYIPVAISGTAVSMLAAESDDTGTAFPDSNYNLTPNMVAGLITGEYQKAQGSVQAFSPYDFTLSDNVIAALGNCVAPGVLRRPARLSAGHQEEALIYNQNLWETRVQHLLPPQPGLRGQHSSRTRSARSTRTWPTDRATRSPTGCATPPTTPTRGRRRERRHPPARIR